MVGVHHHALKLILVSLVVLVLFALFGCSSVSAQTSSNEDTVNMYVFNDLGSGNPLKLHCKSKDDDLGEQVLAPGSDFKWSFKVNFWHTTLFWCNFWWHDSKGGRLVHGGYQVYKAKRDIDWCDAYCAYAVRFDGLYGYDRNISAFSLKYPWAAEDFD